MLDKKQSLPVAMSHDSPFPEAQASASSVSDESVSVESAPVASRQTTAQSDTESEDESTSPTVAKPKRTRRPLTKMQTLAKLGDLATKI
jgi:hypothetical protein